MDDVGEEEIIKVKDEDKKASSASWLPTIFQDHAPNLDELEPKTAVKMLDKIDEEVVSPPIKEPREGRNSGEKSKEHTEEHGNQNVQDMIKSANSVKQDSATSWVPAIFQPNVNELEPQILINEGEYFDFPFWGGVCVATYIDGETLRFYRRNRGKDTKLQTWKCNNAEDTKKFLAGLGVWVLWHGSKGGSAKYLMKVEGLDTFAVYHRERPYSFFTRIKVCVFDLHYELIYTTEH